MTLERLLHTGLNAQQKQAVTHQNGALQVVAGAGSGKTRVITARIAHLITQGVPAESIIALTFTNKAAQEMRERLMHFLGHEQMLPIVGTFHSYCLLLLRRNPTLAPVPNFTILDSDDQQALLKSIIKRHGLEKHYTASKVSYAISSRKNGLGNSDDMHPLLREVFTTYEHEKIESHSLDFDDLLLHTKTMFEKHPEFSENFRRRIRHILVDEYQDTNTVQHKLLKLMALENSTLAIDSMCVVGDEDQSIYSWRGAQPANMLTFQDDFTPVTTIKIEQNYRSVSPILACANAVISHNIMRNPKELWSTREASGRILLLCARSDYQEAEMATALLKRIKQQQKLSNVAILYRTHFQSRVLEEILASNGVPYRIIGGINFYARKEIKDVLAYLRLIINPFDRVSFFRVVNTPLRGLGQKFEEQVLAAWTAEPLLDFRQVLSKILADEAGLAGKKREAVLEFLSIFESLDLDARPGEIATTIINRIGYFSYLRAAFDEQEAETKTENVREFLRSIDNAPHTLADFLHEIALLQEKMSQQEHADEAVQMMTLHAAKGLEFDTVLIVGLEEGLFPSNQSLHAAERLEEERRLFYVGMTRAKERLVLSHALYRNQFGQVNDQLQSRFLSELPKNYIQELDVSHENTAGASRFFASWLAGGGTIQRPQLPPRVVAKPTPKSSTWAKNQPVLHKKFGTGLVVDAQKNDDGTYMVTALFRAGKKKVQSTFLTRV